MSEIQTSLDLLVEPFRGQIRGLLAEAMERRAYFVVTETLRTYERQQYLFENGKTRTLKGNHLIGKAIDVAPVKLYDLNSELVGKVRELGLSEEDKKLPSWVVLGELAVKWGVGWGGCKKGKWANFEDFPHLEFLG